MNVYTIDIIVQDRQQNFHHEAEQSRLAHGEASEKRDPRKTIGASLRQLLTSEASEQTSAQPVQRMTQVPARNRG